MRLSERRKQLELSRIDTVSGTHRQGLGGARSCEKRLVLASKQRPPTREEEGGALSLFRPQGTSTENQLEPPRLLVTPNPRKFHACRLAVCPPQSTITEQELDPRAHAVTEQPHADGIVIDNDIAQFSQRDAQSFHFEVTVQ
jgi:hypothetical protein